MKERIGWSSCTLQGGRHTHKRSHYGVGTVYGHTHIHTQQEMWLEGGQEMWLGGGRKCGWGGGKISPGRMPPPLHAALYDSTVSIYGPYVDPHRQSFVSLCAEVSSMYLAAIVRTCIYNIVTDCVLTCIRYALYVLIHLTTCSRDLTSLCQLALLTKHHFTSLFSLSS